MENWIEKQKARSLIEKEYEWHKWTKEIPYLQFKSEWQVKVIPPTTGAVVRFLVKYKEKQVSVYLDCYRELGAMDEPYWEIYPNFNDDNERFSLNEADELLGAIGKSLTPSDKNEVEKQLEGMIKDLW